VVPTISGPVFMETVESLTAALADDGYQLMLGQSGYADSREDALLEAIIGRRPDGIVLTGIMHSAAGAAPDGERHPGGRDLGPDPHADRHAGSASRTSTPARRWPEYLHARGRRRRRC
jgi:LacI family gluconate utilization system Gnt-I transcriptional repressor